MYEIGSTAMFERLNGPVIFNSTMFFRSIAIVAHSHTHLLFFEFVFFGCLDAGARKHFLYYFFFPFPVK